ncbi:Uncharacterized protein HZ326_28046 [Fusarium oxysporum f. sp. albedinis]|nr:Uncharacterized protein HZ326_28046 [Fusarium oxysporum f. sp. albedinis]
MHPIDQSRRLTMNQSRVGKVCRADIILARLFWGVRASASLTSSFSPYKGSFDIKYADTLTGGGEGVIQSEGCISMT